MKPVMRFVGSDISGGEWLDTVTDTVLGRCDAPVCESCDGEGCMRLIADDGDEMLCTCAACGGTGHQ